jgi:glycosyltransferase involved in cell wall biosynthesis
MIVHTDLAKKVLRQKGIKGSVDVIPHGCVPNEQKPRLWNLYRSPHTFMQFGFGFEYKGWENALRACAVLRQKYPDVFFTGLFSESPFSLNLHEKYFLRLQDLIAELGIAENVSLIRGFQSEEVLDSFFRLNRCAVFPYLDNGEHTVYGVTGAARVAMSHGIPVVTSSVPFFYDLRGTCPQADTPETLADEIEKAWADPTPHVNRQDEFLEANSWSCVARQYVKAMT